MNAATLLQDRASGGAERRQMRIRSGEVVTVSLVIAGKDLPARVSLRFRSGGVMVTRPVGKFEGANQFEIIKLGWEKIRAEKIVEQFDWSWLVP